MEESTSEEKNDKIFVVGIGSPACDVLNKISKFKDLPIERIAMDDDPENLLKTDSDRRIFLDWGPRGMGVCSNPVIGEIAAKNASEKIEKVLGDAETIIFVDLLGGRIGTGALPIIAEIARKNGSRIISILTFPASFEGKIRQNNAVDSILKIRDLSDITLIIPLDRISEILEGKTGLIVFSVTIELVKIVTREMVRFLAKNENMEILNKYSGKREIGTVGIGEGENEKEIKKALEMAFSSPLIIISSGIQKILSEENVDFFEKHMLPEKIETRLALLSIISSHEIDNEYLKNAVEFVRNRISRDAELIFSKSIDESLDNFIQTLLIFIGIEPSKEFFENK